MPGENRNVTWRQADVFSIDDENGDLEFVGVIASHDCDICADNSDEPEIETVEVSLSCKENGSLTFGKNPRRLQVELSNSNSIVQAELDIRKRSLMEKKYFLARGRKFPVQLSGSDIIVFRRWLSARYGRSAFPNAFEERMRGKIQEKIDRLSEKKGRGIRALYFDLDDNTLIERGVGEAYELSIYVVYPTDTSGEEAEQFAEAIKAIFVEECFNADRKLWNGIHLLECDAICEDVFPLSLANSTKSWRVDHRSYKGNPAKNLFPESDR